MSLRTVGRSPQQGRARLTGNPSAASRADTGCGIHGQRHGLQGTRVKVLVRNQKGKAVLDFKGIPVEQVGQLVEALSGQLPPVRRAGTCNVHRPALGSSSRGIRAAQGISFCHVGDPSCSSAILVVDDEMDILDAIADLLTHAGFTAVTATNGRDGLHRLAEMGRPCLILLDLMLPVMSGYEVLARLEADPVLCTIPIVVMTAARRPQPPGARGLLWKPFGVKELFAAVEAHCSKSEEPLLTGSSEQPGPPGAARR